MRPDSHQRNKIRRNNNKKTTENKNSSGYSYNSQEQYHSTYHGKLVLDYNTATIPEERKKELLDFCKRVNIRFNRLELLNTAFNHKSISNEKHELVNNERLEFLGDSVLGLVTASYLYRNVHRPEGELAKIKGAAVSENALAPIGFKFGLDKLLVLGHGEEKDGGRKKQALIADCMEAVIGALYLDSGFQAAQKYVLSFIKPEVDKNVSEGTHDYKTILQEKSQAILKINPTYELKNVIGPANAREFTVFVHLGDKVYGPCKASSRKKAEQIAAKIALEDITKH